MRVAEEWWSVRAALLSHPKKGGGQSSRYDRGKGVHVARSWGGYLESFSGKPTALNAMGASPGRSERVVMA